MPRIRTTLANNSGTYAPLPVASRNPLTGWFHADGYGCKGDGSTDNAAALAALATAVVAAGGGVVYFGPSEYKTSGTIDVSATSVPIIFRGSGGMGDGTAATQLSYTGTDGNALIKCGSSRNVSIERMACRFTSASYTGKLLNGDAVNSSNTAFLTLNDVKLSGAGPSAGAALLSIDGSHDTYLTRVQFGGGCQVGIFGKSQQTLTATAGFAIRVGLQQCSFQGQYGTAHMKNADVAWDINATFEPITTAGAAGSYKHDSGVIATGVTFRGCYFSDDQPAQTGSWITFGGKGFTLQGCYISANSATKIVTVDENNSSGFSVFGNWLNGSSGTGFDWGSTTGGSRVAIFGNSWNGSWTTAFNNIPGGSFYGGPSGSGFTVDTPTMTGTATTADISSSGTVQAQSGKFGSGGATNLLTADGASFESGTGSWTSNANATVAQSTTQALAGTHSLKVTAVATLADTAIRSAFITGIVAGATYTAFCSSFAETAARSVRVDLQWFDSGNVQVGSNIVGTAQTNTLGAWVQAASITAVAPTNAVKVQVLIHVLSATASDVTYVDAAQFAAGTSTAYSAPGNAAPHQLLATTLGFFGATPVIRPTGTPAAAADLATALTLVNALRTDLLSLGLIA